MSISSVIGHKKNIKFLLKTIRKDEISHSYIFEGSSGIGKKKVALEISKYILCKNATDDSCNICKSCVEFNTLNHSDFMLIEAEGNSIKNEKIEEFQEFIHIKPNENDKKIVVIDNSELMTISAQNRILKILEEPPKYALIILITARKSSLVQTIVSRCQSINFNNLLDEEINEFLINNGVDFEKSRIFSKFSNGSIVLARKLIDNDNFMNLRDKVMELSNILIYKKKCELFDMLKNFEDLKNNQYEILNLLEIWFRDLLLLSLFDDEKVLFNIDKVDILKKQSKTIEINKLVQCLEFISSSRNKLEKYVNYALVLEDLFLKIQEV
ncbi:DNA polymerase III subunit [Helicovermis profundi]|uniref:DNA polymerase III subunit delta' n=1 Tax=Helicovermis profundi TaxID=3065157 RepID=A0AAU9EAZ3_9FIRM|nr:DNA polymerase III subunit delta' C-terminal domain-containing protein [Clostridia bacterium S502]